MGKISKRTGQRPQPAQPRPANARAKQGAGGKSRPTQPQDGRDARTGRFEPGHRFWEARASSGPAPKFVDAEGLWKACVEYFCWVEDNPLHEVQLVTFQGLANQVNVSKMRAMTLRGLCRYLDIAHTTWSTWKRDRLDLMPAIERAEAVIYEQKFTGAAAGLLNANLIARELGLADKTELAGEGGGPIRTEDVTPQRPDDDRLNEILARYGGGAGGSEVREAREARDVDQIRQEKFDMMRKRYGGEG